jgi:hypothetical protein
MFTSYWPIGTIHYVDMPMNLQIQLLALCPGLVVPTDVFPPAETASEGTIISFSGYKLRVTIDPSTSEVKLA